MEIRNEGNRILYVQCCQSNLTGQIYFHISDKKSDLQCKGKIYKISPGFYEIVKPIKVKY